MLWRGFSFLPSAAPCKGQTPGRRPFRLRRNRRAPPDETALRAVWPAAFPLRKPPLTFTHPLRPRRCPLYHPGPLPAAALPPPQTLQSQKDPPAENSVGGMVCRWEQVPCGPFTSRCAVGAPEGYAVVPSPEVPEAAGFVPLPSPPPSPPSPPGVGGVGGVGGFCCRAARSCCSCSSVLPVGS